QRHERRATQASGRRAWGGGMRRGPMAELLGEGAVAKGALRLVRPDVAGARRTDHQMGFAHRSELLGLGGPGDILHDDVEQSVIERLSGGARGFHDSLALSLARELERAVMAEGIVSRAPQRDEARPRASTHALFGIVTGRTEPPK